MKSGQVIKVGNQAMFRKRKEKIQYQQSEDRVGRNRSLIVSVSAAWQAVVSVVSAGFFWFFWFFGFSWFSWFFGFDFV
jgi:hypothetical protein